MSRNILFIILLIQSFAIICFGAILSVSLRMEHEGMFCLHCETDFFCVSFVYIHAFIIFLCSDHPDECWIKEYNKSVALNEIWIPEGDCVRYSCDKAAKQFILTTYR